MFIIIRTKTKKRDSIYLYQITKINSVSFREQLNHFQARKKRFQVDETFSFHHFVLFLFHFSGQNWEIFTPFLFCGIKHDEMEKI